MKKHKRKGIILYGILMVLLCTGCGGKTQQNEAGNYYYYPKEEAETQEFAVETDGGQELFALVSIDYTDEVLHVYRYANGLEYQYYYGLTTGFYDKYGNLTAASNFVPGTMVYLGRTDTKGKLTEIRIADSVWQYAGVNRFQVDEERRVFTIAGTDYTYQDDLFVFSDDKQIGLSDLTNQDLLTVIGKDKQILSVMVTTGHGELQLLNTSLFEGSYLQLDTSYFVIITPNLKVEIPEGTYTLAVANDGWGGSCEVEVVRGETTTVDLDELKGEGPSYGMITFDVDVEDAQIAIDHEDVAANTPVSLKYGWHSITVSAEGYDDWKKKLYVNSEEATVYIELEQTSDTVVTTPVSESSEDTQAATDTQTTSQSQSTQSTTNSRTTQGTKSTQSTTKRTDYLDDYMSTLTELIGTF